MSIIWITLISLISVLLANAYIINIANAWYFIALIILFLLFNIFPVYSRKDKRPFLLRMCNQGNHLLISFLITAGLSFITNIIYFFNADFWKLSQLIASVIVAFVVCALLFVNGIVRIYLSSVQLGIKLRIIGAVFGLVPIINFVILIIIIKTTINEVMFETEKIMINEARADEQICKTKYPLLLVHGVFFRDMPVLNYWGRIPEELEKNGARIYYGKHDSASAVSVSGNALARRIKDIVEETGCEKVNVIAHSKGGLDTRYAIGLCGVANQVASLITINTPHRGCLFADYLLKKIPKKKQKKIEDTYNMVAKKLGDDNPDFMAAVKDLTEAGCKILNETIPEVDGIYKASVGSVLDRASRGTFPLNYTYLLAKYFSGPNDGLVDEDSFSWGESLTMITTEGRKGVSHGDVVDLNRKNIPGFDVREFYVNIVSDLKKRGY